MKPYTAIDHVTPPAERLKTCAKELSTTNPPRIVAPIVSTPPITDASTTWPGRSLYMYSPTNSAIGIVQAIVNVPQELPGTRRTAPGGMAARPSFQNNGVDDFMSNSSENVIDCWPLFQSS